MQAKLCVNENIPVIPIPGPSALVAALSASGLATDEFTFGRVYLGFLVVWGALCWFVIEPKIRRAGAVGFLPKHAKSRRERLSISAAEMTTQIFYVPPHKLHQFLEETSSLFGDSRWLFWYPSWLKFFYVVLLRLFFFLFDETLWLILLLVFLASQSSYTII